MIIDRYIVTPSNTFLTRNYKETTMNHTSSISNQKYSNIQFDIYDQKNRKLGLQIKTYNYQKMVNDFTVDPTKIDTSFYFVAELHQTRNNKTYGGSSSWEQFLTKDEMQQWIDTKISKLQKTYAKKFVEMAVA